MYVFKTLGSNPELIFQNRQFSAFSHNQHLSRDSPIDSASTLLATGCRPTQVPRSPATARLQGGPGSTRCEVWGGRMCPKQLSCNSCFASPGALGQLPKFLAIFFWVSPHIQRVIGTRAQALTNVSGPYRRDASKQLCLP
jgi:hypothetical protein